MRLLLPAVLLTTVASLGACATSSTAPWTPAASPQTRQQTLSPHAGQQEVKNNPAVDSHAAAYAIMQAKLSGPAELKLEYSAGYAPCYGKLGRVEVEQDTKQVIVTLHRAHPQPAGKPQMCAQYRKLEWTSVKLDAPLGNRTLVDGSTGKPVPVH